MQPTKNQTHMHKACRGKMMCRQSKNLQVLYSWKYCCKRKNNNQCQCLVAILKNCINIHRVFKAGVSFVATIFSRRREKSIGLAFAKVVSHHRRFIRQGFRTLNTCFKRTDKNPNNKNHNKNPTHKLSRAFLHCRNLTNPLYPLPGPHSNNFP